MKKRFLSLVILLTLLLFQPSSSFGQSVTPSPSPTVTPGGPTPTPDTSGKLSEIKKNIDELEKKVIDLQSQEKTLSSQISVADSQIKLTQLRINQTKEEIDTLNDDINSASTRISNLEGSLDDITKALLNRIVATYQIGSIQPMQMLLTANNATDFLTRANYLRIVQAHDKKLLYDIQQAKTDYENQKSLFEEKKVKVVSLKTQLEEYNKQIDEEKKAKEDLLRVTKNDESKYQNLLAAARAEQNAIEGVISSLQLKDGTPVKQGQTIAVVGNSGAPVCSTGPHLHFEVRKGGGLENPSNYLKSGVNFQYSYDSGSYDYYGTINPSGSYDWPLDETITINQAYGSHGYARSFYSGGSHTGIDMVGGSSLIKASKDGTLYKGTTSCGSAVLNYVAVDHGDGVVFWYWHVR